MRNSSVRRCKVGQRCQERTSTLSTRDAWGMVQSQRKISSLVPCPMIRLSGFWLEDAGFDVGDVLTVHVADGQILIRKEVSPDAVRVCAVAGGQTNGPAAGVGGLSLVEGRPEAVSSRV